MSESEPVFEPEPSEQDEYYYEDPNSYDDGTTENYYDPTTEESIVMVYPSRRYAVIFKLQQRIKRFLRRSGRSSGKRFFLRPAFKQQPYRQELDPDRCFTAHFVRRGIGFFVYSMFILPYLRKRKALQKRPRLAYAGASASGLAEVPAEAESDDFYEDAYGNRYRAEELPGFWKKVPEKRILRFISRFPRFTGSAVSGRRALCGRTSLSIIPGQFGIFSCFLLRYGALRRFTNSALPGCLRQWK